LSLFSFTTPLADGGEKKREGEKKQKKKRGKKGGKNYLKEFMKMNTCPFPEGKKQRLIRDTKHTWVGQFFNSRFF